jgi:predicted hotdog family 3-hydroxylacyl-ACP dehydratase
LNFKIFISDLPGVDYMDNIKEIENLIPHRGRMRLIDTIVRVDRKQAVARATVKESWPLLSGNAVSALVLVELAAQTAGVCIGWHEKMKTDGPKTKAAGWLVGIKKAGFYVEKIPVGTCLTTQSEIHLVVDNYKEIIATASINQKPVAEIYLQILQKEVQKVAASSG